MKKDDYSRSKRWGQGRGGRPWRRLRDAVFKRDGYLCTLCKDRGEFTPCTICDHIVPVHLGGKDTLDNLRALCDGCHDPLSKSQALDAYMSKCSKTKRADEDGWI